MPSLLRIVGALKLTFQEEYVNAPTTTTIEAIGDNQVPIPIIVPSVVVNDDIPVQLPIQLEAPPTRFEEPHQEIVEEPQQLQPEVPLRRSTRERRKAIIYSIEFPVKQLTKPHMSYGRVRSLVLDICTSGVVQLKQGLIGPMKENWTQGLLAVILWDTLRGLKAMFGTQD